MRKPGNNPIGREAARQYVFPLFAYGSSLLSEQMKNRKVWWEESRVEKAELENFRLTFRGESERSEYRFGGLADLDAEPESKVLGVVYWTDGHMDGLDRAEGVFMPYPRGCCRIQVTVRTGGGMLAAQTYVRKYKSPPNPPHDNYLRKLVEGARAHGLPAEWINEINESAQRSDSESRR